jgi:hypothetical protein
MRSVDPGESLVLSSSLEEVLAIVDAAIALRGLTDLQALVFHHKDKDCNLNAFGTTATWFRLEP